MDAKKLMVGDWLKSQKLYGKAVRVVEIGSNGEVVVSDGGSWMNGKDATPIALSPEILENNDFWGENNTWSWWNDEHTQSIDIYWEYDIAHVEVEDNLQTHIETRITDVHELQHLIAVAGIDLDIKL